MSDKHAEFRHWSEIAAKASDPSVRRGAEFALALFTDCDALAADITSMQMAYEAAHEQSHQMRERAEARLAEAERAIKDANEALHGYGVEDQGQAYDKACQILDAYTPETVDGGEQ